MNPPNKFCNDLEGWVYRKSAPSIVSVEFWPDSFEVYSRWCHVFPLVDGQDNSSRLADCQKNMYSTAFFVEPEDDDPLHIFVLTCAHAIGPMFSPQRPITVAQIARLYQPYIICDHREHMYLGGLKEDAARHYTRATVHSVSLDNDLLLLQITRVHMAHYCQEPHPPMFLAPRFPRPLKKVVMVSWPGTGRNRTAVTGETSNRRRQYNVLDTDNPSGYTATLSEVNITCENGSSGAPLLDGVAEVVGLFHGSNGKMSYFISLGDLRQTLTEWGIRT